MIKANNLTKAFKRNVAVDGLDLEINQREVFGILGPNGAGKTTTVRMLACLIAPTSGGATVIGYEISKLWFTTEGIRSWASRPTAPRRSSRVAGQAAPGE